MHKYVNVLSVLAEPPPPWDDESPITFTMPFHICHHGWPWGCFDTPVVALWKDLYAANATTITSSSASSSATLNVAHEIIEQILLATIWCCSSNLPLAMRRLPLSCGRLVYVDRNLVPRHDAVQLKQKDPRMASTKSGWHCRPPATNKNTHTHIRVSISLSLSLSLSFSLSISLSIYVYISLSAYINIYIYTYICIYIYMYIYIDMHIYIYIYICTHTYMYTYTHIRINK